MKVAVLGSGNVGHIGIWVQASEGAKFWAGVCAELRNRAASATPRRCPTGAGVP